MASNETLERTSVKIVESSWLFAWRDRFVSSIVVLASGRSPLSSVLGRHDHHRTRNAECN